MVLRPVYTAAFVKGNFVVTFRCLRFLVFMFLVWAIRVAQAQS